MLTIRNFSLQATRFGSGRFGSRWSLWTGMHTWFCFSILHLGKIRPTERGGGRSVLIGLLAVCRCVSGRLYKVGEKIVSREKTVKHER